jgi:hypothetical protein
MKTNYKLSVFANPNDLDCAHQIKTSKNSRQSAKFTTFLNKNQQANRFFCVPVSHHFSLISTYAAAAFIEHTRQKSATFSQISY